MLSCPCGEQFTKRDAPRVMDTRADRLLGGTVTLPKRVPVRIVFTTDRGGRREKQPDAEDLERIQAMEAFRAPSACPVAPVRHWGDLYRAGYHSGITHLHHFYTWRNFISVVAVSLEAAARSLPDPIRFLG